MHTGLAALIEQLMQHTSLLVPNGTVAGFPKIRCCFPLGTDSSLMPAGTAIEPLADTVAQPGPLIVRVNVAFPAGLVVTELALSVPAVVLPLAGIVLYLTSPGRGRTLPGRNPRAR